MHIFGLILFLNLQMFYSSVSFTSIKKYNFVIKFGYDYLFLFCVPQERIEKLLKECGFLNLNNLKENCRK